jgi:transcriptional regulator with XRE-family HTH domain
MNQMPFIFEYGEILKLFRERAKLTQKAVAKELGLTSDTIANYEKGITHPSLNALRILKRLYGPDFEYVVDLLDRNDGIMQISVPFRDSLNRITLPIPPDKIRKVKYSDKAGLERFRRNPAVGHVTAGMLDLSEEYFMRMMYPRLYFAKQYIKYADAKRKREKQEQRRKQRLKQKQKNKTRS